MSLLVCFTLVNTSKQNMGMDLEDGRFFFIKYVVKSRTLNVHTRDFMWPKVITSWTPRLGSSFEVSGHTWVVYFYATCRFLTNLALKK